MKNKKIAVALGLIGILCLGACGKEEVSNNAAQAPELGTQTKSEQKNDETIEVKEEIEGTSAETAEFSAVAGSYIFSSGVGAWGTELTINPDGSFYGEFSDSDMGDVGEGYPNGICYLCDFEGRFVDLEQVDEFTYKAKIDDMSYEREAGTEEIINEIKYVYSEPYGLTGDGQFEFYLAGKAISDISMDCIDWTFLRYGEIFPTKLPYKLVYNVSEMETFNESDYTKEKSDIPKSLEIDWFELAGAYINDNGAEMDISIYTDFSDMAEGDPIGNISWVLSDDAWYYSPDATIIPAENGYVGDAGYLGKYSIIITDNTSGEVTFEVYDEDGYDCGTYQMIARFES